MATPFDRLMETVRPYLPGAIDTAMKQELFAVCEEFFTDSNTWQENVPFTIVQGSDTAELMPYTGKIERLNWVTDQNGFSVNRCTITDIYNGIIRAPQANPGTYNAQLIMNVNDPISRDVFPIVPVGIVDRYWQTLMHGLISHMMVMPNKPYTSVQMAAVYNSKFMGGIARARNEANEMFTQNSQAWRFPQTFNRSKNSRR